MSRNELTRRMNRLAQERARSVYHAEKARLTAELRQAAQQGRDPVAVLAELEDEMLRLQAVQARRR